MEEGQFRRMHAPERDFDDMRLEELREAWGFPVGEPLLAVGLLQSRERLCQKDSG